MQLLQKRRRKDTFYRRIIMSRNSPLKDETADASSIDGIASQNAPRVDCRLWRERSPAINAIAAVKKTAS